MNEKIENLLNEARHSVKHDWQVYEFFKGQVIKWTKSDQEYNEAIKKIVEILEV
jgi:hypothetical protein